MQMHNGKNVNTIGLNAIDTKIHLAKRSLIFAKT